MYGNYLRIYKNLDEFKANTFNLPYPCVSVVDDDTIETDEEIVEFEQLDKLSFKVEVPTASTTITQGVWFDAYYSIDLQGQWRMSSAVTNPDSNLYDGVYESFSNYNVNSSSATCVITIDGYSNFKFYIRSYGESSYDYVNVYDLDGANTIKATTKGKSNSGTTLESYTLVEFTNLDGGEHTIKVVYRKDNSSHSGTDRGYLMIPYNQDE